MPARRLACLLTVLAVVVAGWLPTAGVAAAETLVTRELTFTADDGVMLHALVGGVGGLKKRPLIVESSPYGPGCCTTFAGPTSGLWT